MGVRLLYLFLGFCAAFLASLGCGSNGSDRVEDGRLPVFAGVPPVGYLVERIGGPHVRVDVLVRPGQDPHVFEPSPKQVVALGRAALFFKADMPFENVLLEKIARGNRRLEVVDTTQGIEKRPLDVSCGDIHHEHDHATHAAGEPDPHVWLSPAALKIQAENIAAALARADPEHEADYRKNLGALIENLDALDARIRQKLEPHRGRTFYVFHPAFGYFADAYGLKQKAVETAGRSPTPKELRDLIAQARSDGVKTIFAQPEFSPHGAEALAAALGGRVVMLNGLASDVPANLEDIAEKIERAMKE